MTLKERLDRWWTPDTSREREVMQELRVTVSELQRENERLRGALKLASAAMEMESGDAGRYRWLRAAINNGGKGGKTEIDCGRDTTIATPETKVRRSTLDEAIDAAMATLPNRI